MIYCFPIDIIKIMDLNFTIIIKRKEKKIIWLYLNGLKLESDYEEVKISTVHWRKYRNLSTAVTSTNNHITN